MQHFAGGFQLKKYFISTAEPIKRAIIYVITVLKTIDVQLFQGLFYPEIHCVLPVR
jgi:hypothetical protein